MFHLVKTIDHGISEHRASEDNCVPQKNLQIDLQKINMFRVKSNKFAKKRYLFKFKKISQLVNQYFSGYSKGKESVVSWRYVIAITILAVPVLKGRTISVTCLCNSYDLR